MNPPYSGNLHLKILSKIISEYPNAEIVNLSPIRWLQDPLAEYKKNSDFKKFEDIRKHIESLDIVSAKDAVSMFGAEMIMDLGAYHITNKEYNKNFFRNPLIEKVYKQIKVTLYDKLEKNAQDGWRVRLTEIRPYSSVRPNAPSAIAMKYETTSATFSWVYKDGFTKDGIHWSQNKSAKAGGRHIFTEDDILPLSIKFDSEQEAINFEQSTKTKFHKYLVSNIKTDQNFPFRFLPFMPTYTHPWTDADFYEYFGLTDDEIKEIECLIKL